MFESGAILLYLVEKAGALLPVAPRERSAVQASLVWQMGGQGPMLGQAAHFRNYVPETIPYAIERYTNEAARLYRVLDTRVKGGGFIAGDYSIADIACWPWILFRAHHGIALEDYPEVARWFANIHARPAVVRALEDVTVAAPQIFDQETKRILFNIAKD